MLTPKTSPQLRPESADFMSPPPKSPIHFQNTHFITSAKGQKIFISAIPKTHDYLNYKARHPKGSRLNEINNTLGDISVFIDDDQKNVRDVKEKCPNTMAYQYQSGLLTDEFISEICTIYSGTLALDFDQTFTNTHTFQSTQLVLNKDIASIVEQHKYNYNADIVELIQQWPGNVLIITDHNNYEFIKAMLIKVLDLIPEPLPPLLTLNQP